MGYLCAFRGDMVRHSSLPGVEFEFVRARVPFCFVVASFHLCVKLRANQGPTRFYRAGRVDTSLELWYAKPLITPRGNLRSVALACDQDSYQLYMEHARHFIRECPQGRSGNGLPAVRAEGLRADANRHSSLGGSRRYVETHRLLPCRGLVECTSVPNLVVGQDF